MAKDRNSDVFNRALAAFLKWGPAQRLDPCTRIAKASPGLSRPEVEKLVKEFESLRSAACRIVEEQVEKHDSEENGRNRVSTLDDRLSSENASLLYQQARYSAWRDGFR